MFFFWGGGFISSHVERGHVSGVRSRAVCETSGRFPEVCADAEEVVSWSVSHHLMSDTLPAVNEGRLQLPAEWYGLQTDMDG